MSFSRVKNSQRKYNVLFANRKFDKWTEKPYNIFKCICAQLLSAICSVFIIENDPYRFGDGLEHRGTSWYKLTRRRNVRGIQSIFQC